MRNERQKPVTGGMPANTFEGNCVHVRKDQDCCQTWKPTDTCYFLALDSAGERTMEQCLEEGTQGPGEKAVKYQVIGALKALQQIHERGWSHNDFQLKNIMMNDMCQSSSVRAVDLDGMSRKHGPRGIRMLRDVAMFMGLCDQGAFPLPQMVAEVDRKGRRNATAGEKPEVVMPDISFLVVNSMFGTVYGGLSMYARVEAHPDELHQICRQDSSFRTRGMAAPLNLASKQICSFI